MELRENMYIRTSEGIRKILYENEEGYELNKYLHYRYPEGHHLYKEDLKDDIIIKASDKLIDLVEVGDYINGLRVEKSKYGLLYTSYTYMGGDIGLQSETYTTFLKDFKEDDIYSILTKEQFEQMSYKVGE